MKHILTRPLAQTARLAVALTAVTLAACADHLTAPTSAHSGYGVPNGTDVSDSGSRPNKVPVTKPSFGRSTTSNPKAHPRAELDCFSGYIIAYGPDGEPVCVPE
jgi:hypothetical protein